MKNIKWKKKLFKINKLSSLTSVVRRHGTAVTGDVVAGTWHVDVVVVVEVWLKIYIIKFKLEQRMIFDPKSKQSCILIALSYHISIDYSIFRMESGKSLIMTNVLLLYKDQPHINFLEAAKRSFNNLTRSTLILLSHASHQTISSKRSILIIICCNRVVTGWTIFNTWTTG